IDLLHLIRVVEDVAQLFGEQLDLGIAQFQIRERGDRLNLRSGKSIGHAEMLASFANFSRSVRVGSFKSTNTEDTEVTESHGSIKFCRVTPFASVLSVLVLF